MSVVLKPLFAVMQPLVMGLIIGLVSVSLGFMPPAYADNASAPTQYIAADGTDLTAIAQCLPKELSQADLARVLRESGNDFLQKVFSTKDSYSDYKVDAAEAKYLDCLKTKGFVSQVER
jgi:hypothetical protein